VGGEVIMLGGVVEVGLAGANGRKPVVDAGDERDAIAARAHGGEALAETARLVGGTRHAVGPGKRKPQLLDAGGEGGCCNACLR
jgi:hypothetical protein